METGSPTPEQARAALEAADHVRDAVTRRAATPWPHWFTACTAVYCASIPVAYGGAVADPRWLLPQWAWLALALTLLAGFLALFTVAGLAWTRRTGVAVRLDLLPRWMTIALAVGYPVMAFAAAGLFRVTDSPAVLFVAAGLGALVVVGPRGWAARRSRTQA